MLELHIFYLVAAHAQVPLQVFAQCMEAFLADTAFRPSTPDPSPPYPRLPTISLVLNLGTVYRILAHLTLTPSHNGPLPPCSSPNKTVNKVWSNVCTLGGGGLVEGGPVFCPAGTTLHLIK